MTRYAVALLLGAVAATVTGLDLLHVGGLTYAPPLLAVVIAAWIGGLGPGLAAAATSTAGVATAHLLTGGAPLLLRPGQTRRLGAFLLAALVASAMLESLRRARARAEAMAASNARLTREATEALATARREAERNARLVSETQEALATAEEASLRAEESAAEAESSAIEREEAVTEAEEANRQQAETLAVLDAVLASAPVGLGLVDRELRFVRANDALAAMDGLPVEAHVGRTLAEVLPSWAPAFAAFFRRVFDTGVAVVDREMGVADAAGRQHNLLVSFYPVRSPAGAVAWAGAAVVDITERQRAEERLRHAQKMEAVGRVAGGVAHEINNMMTVILGFSDFVGQQVEPHSRVLAELREIRRAAERSADITKQLLAYSRRAVVQPRRVDVNVVVSEMGNILRRLMGDQSTLALDLAADLEPVRADRGQLEQVLINLALNARDAMPDGGRTTVTTRNTAAAAEDRGAEAAGDARYVLLEFRDTGVGMTEEVQARLFEPFFTTKPFGQGTGLGLATVYGIVAQASGHVLVESAPGHGTTIRVFLPVDREAAAASASAAAPVTAGSARGHETVLVVEDEESVRKMTRRALELEGYRVLDASNGREALRLLERHGREIALLVTDVFMPEMGGRELMEAARAAQPALKVVFMSGYTDDDIMRRGIAELGAPFLQKPFTPGVLTATIRETLDRPPVWTRASGGLSM